MGPQSVLGDYVIDLMHDKNEAIRQMCENALVIIGVSFFQEPTIRLSFISVVIISGA